MRLPKLPLAALLALSVFGLGASAQAQDKPTDDNYMYHFDDDFMVGDTLDTTPALLKVRKPAARVTLIRPRASFVPELLESVDVM